VPSSQKCEDWFGARRVDFFSLGGHVESPASESQVPLRPMAAGSEPTGLLLCRDLIFTSKIKGTAADLGYSLMVASSDLQARSMIEMYSPRVVLVDLTAGDLVAPRALMSYQELARSTAWFVAFGSHVDVDKLVAAKAAGCHVVLPRSRFTAELPTLLRRYFCEPARRDA
jgi:hypothetical protein